MRFFNVIRMLILIFFVLSDLQCAKKFRTPIGLSETSQRGLNDNRPIYQDTSGNFYAYGKGPHGNDKGYWPVKKIGSEWKWTKGAKYDAVAKIEFKPTTLIDWTERLFKGLPEFIGKNKNRPTPVEMQSFYNDSNAWAANTYTLKQGELIGVIDAFVNQCKKDPLFNDSNKWVNKSKPPANLFDSSNDPEEIAYPYIQKIDISENSEICFVGDLHGSVHSFVRTLWRLLLLGYMDNNFKLKDNFYIVLLGDYSDRGNGTAELWYTLINLKLKNWNQVVLLRGNHDVWAHHQTWGNSTFKSELDYKFGNSEKNIKNKVKCLYNLLPHALLIGTGRDYVLCAHGGIDVSYNASTLLQSGNFYEFLSAGHNFGYDVNKSDQRHGGWKSNAFTARWYNGAALVSDSAFFQNNPQIHAVFRGHQHEEMPNCFCVVKKDFSVGSGTLPGFDMPGNVATSDQQAIINGTYKLDNENYHPIYTLISATGNHTASDSFLISKTSKNYSDWTLRLFSSPVKPGLLRKFARLEKFFNEHFYTIYQDKTPFDDCIDEELKNVARELDVTSDFQAKLTRLKQNLTTLKKTLGTLGGRLDSLISAF